MLHSQKEWCCGSETQALGSCGAGCQTTTEYLMVQLHWVITVCSLDPAAQASPGLSLSSWSSVTGTTQGQPVNVQVLSGSWSIMAFRGWEESVSSILHDPLNELASSPEGGTLLFPFHVVDDDFLILLLIGPGIQSGKRDPR